jgi:hypothetical protein
VEPVQEVEEDRFLLPHCIAPGPVGLLVMVVMSRVHQAVEPAVVIHWMLVDKQLWVQVLSIIVVVYGMLQQAEEEEALFFLLEEMVDISSMQRLRPLVQEYRWRLEVGVAEEVQQEETKAIVTILCLLQEEMEVQAEHESNTRFKKYNNLFICHLTNWANRQVAR